MRVISGKYKGKKLIPPADMSVRPTTDRIKETVFNILCSRYGGVTGNVLDLFCGSGALGIEALSRGAEYAVFVDKSPQSVKLTYENLKGVKEKYSVYNTDYRVALEKLNEPFDIIFLDPPYKDKFEFTALDIIEKKKLLKRGGVVFAEHSRENSLINLSSSFIIDTRNCGNTGISFITYAEDCNEK